jgi:hypothetical protein
MQHGIFDLFRTLGSRTYLLTRLDKNTRRLHAQAAAEADIPREANLRRAVSLLAADVRKARLRKLKTVFYFVYAGHGNTKKQTSYITLEDQRLSGPTLRTLINKVGPHQTHIIVDACHSYFLAHSRGPGGRRRRLRGYSKLKQVFSDRVGLLLSTTSAKKSHEWEAYQSGVFSHEVRSGLYGAADVNQDGQVSYREIAAFVSRANAAIPNEKFRPHVYARPPRATPILMDLRKTRQARLIVGGNQHARYALENTRGVRLADFHNQKGQAVQLIRPANGGLLYLRRLSDDREFVIAPSRHDVRLASLTSQSPRVRSRGAAHHAFSLLFALPFDRQVVERFRIRQARGPFARDTGDDGLRRTGWRPYLGWTSVALGVGALASGIALTISSHKLASELDRSDSHARFTAVNDAIDTRNKVATVLYGAAGVAATVGLMGADLSDRVS